MKSRESSDFHSAIDDDRDDNQDDLTGADAVLAESFDREDELQNGRPESTTDGLPMASSLSIADFQLIGLHPRETRLAVIRRAASRTARALATLQLSSPSATTEQQLSQIALSTYRLLDPRQRGDRHSRAHVGRIRPGVLQSAGRASFSEHRERIQRPESEDVASERVAVEPSPVGLVNVGKGTEKLSSSLPVRQAREDSIDLPPITIQAFEAPFVPRGPHASVWESFRHHSQRPGAVMMLIVVLILAAIGVWYWGHTLSQMPRDRFNQR